LPIYRATLVHRLAFAFDVSRAMSKDSLSWIACQGLMLSLEIQTPGKPIVLYEYEGLARPQGFAGKL
jgi:hypothetical protein